MFIKSDLFKSCYGVQLSVGLLLLHVLVFSLEKIFEVYSMRAYARQGAGIAVYFFTIISDRPTKCQIDSMDLRLNSLLHVNNFESSLELVLFFKNLLNLALE